MRRNGAIRQAVLLLLSPPVVTEGLLTKGRGGGWSCAISSPGPPSSRDPPLTTTTNAFFSNRSGTGLLLPPPSPSPLSSLVLFSTATPSPSSPRGGSGQLGEAEEEDWGSEWEEEEDVEPAIGDGGDGGGVVLGDVAWGERTLSVAREVLLDFGDDMAMYAFKVSPRGYIYVRLDKLTSKYGCPSMEEIESFNNLYKKRLDEIGERGEIPVNFALEVSSPGAERLLKVPEDLDRFKELPMRVQYLEEGNDGSRHQQLQERVLMLESAEAETGHCMWKLADVKENRADVGKGRPLSRKQKDWRLRLPFASIGRVMLFLDSKN